MENRQEVQFAVKTDGGVVQKIGRSYITCPAIRYKGAGIKWLDDKKRVKRGGALL